MNYCEENVKVIAMIPARLGSKRVASKNIRYLGDMPLISHVLETVSQCDFFDGVYLNSESELLRPFAEHYGFEFYHRPPNLSLDSSTNDEFALDFINSIDCDVLVQILPTSPFLSLDEIKQFVEYIRKNDVDTLISVNRHQISSVTGGGDPINFLRNKPNPLSQNIVPVLSYATALMGWRTVVFKSNMQQLGAAYHGGSGKTEYFPLCGLSSIDIDNEEDFRMAEIVFQGLYREKQAGKPPVKYYTGGDAGDYSVETDVPTILKKDGVLNTDFTSENCVINNVRHIIKEKGLSQSWCKRLVNTENNSATLICQLPGEGNRRHYHPDWNEWWFIVKGEWEWEIEGQSMIVKENDVVFIEKSKWHKITAMGSAPAIRLAVSRSDVEHVYEVSVPAGAESEVLA